MEGKSLPNNQQGFTLVEIIAVLVLLGILAAVAVPKFIDLTTAAKDQAVNQGVAELNARESMVWSKIKMTPAGWASDDATFAAVDADLGGKYNWTAAASSTGGTLQFDSGTPVALDRTASTMSSPGNWKRSL